MITSSANASHEPKRMMPYMTKWNPKYVLIKTACVYSYGGFDQNQK